MAFTLRVSTGGGEAEELSFDSPDVRLGRTADNDVVIKDPSSSRSHARVYQDEGQYLVEDLKSANGTKLNGRPLKKPMPLTSGDQIVIGDVVLEFTDDDAPATAAPSSTMADPPEDDEEAVDPGGDPNATMVKPPRAPTGAIKKVPPPRRAPTPPPPEPEEEESAEPPEDEPQDEAPAEEEGDDTRDVPPRAIQKRGAAAAAPVRGARPAAAPLAPVSAAERARQRRELQKSTSGRAMLLWNDLPLPGKVVLGIGMLAVVAGMLVGLVMLVMPKRVVRKVEEVTLAPNADPLPESFGLGDVDFEKPDQKSFTFSYASPTAIVGVLHYQARECSKDEVTIELNGSSVGSVPPDTVDVSNRQLEVVLPATQLKINDPNELVFDNVNNPPGEDSWAVWNVWVEVIPIPQMSSEEAAGRAKEDLERGAKYYETRAVGAMNLFRSWKQYRDAWLLLEATPDRPPELLQIARTRMREIRPELDRKCSAMLVDYQKVINQRYPDFNAARKVLQNIPDHFEKEHPCYGMSRGLLRSLEDLSGSE